MKDYTIAIWKTDYASPAARSWAKGDEELAAVYSLMYHSGLSMEFCNGFTENSISVFLREKTKGDQIMARKEVKTVQVWEYPYHADCARCRYDRLHPFLQASQLNPGVHNHQGCFETREAIDPDLWIKQLAIVIVVLVVIASLVIGGFMYDLLTHVPPNVHP